MMEIGDAARLRLGQSKITSKLPAVELNAISASFMFADPKFEKCQPVQLDIRQGRSNRLDLDHLYIFHGGIKSPVIGGSAATNGR